jgi:N-acetylneuraminic acid mutarotase
VLAVAGADASSNALASAEMYDLASGTWAAAGTLCTARAAHTATHLTNGQVLVIGGYTNSSGGNFATASAELYNPASGTWASTAPLSGARQSHTATLLPNGKVLVTGGFLFDGTTNVYIASAELYDAVAGVWTNVGAMNTARAFHTATLLTNSHVLVATGWSPCGSCIFWPESYDPSTGTWTSLPMTGAPAGSSKYSHPATLLPDGEVLISGLGLECETYNNPGAGQWTGSSHSVPNQFSPTATLLADNRVLVAGGDDGNGNVLANAWTYDPTSTSRGWLSTGSTIYSYKPAAATLLPSGSVLVSGGPGGSPYSAPGNAELYDRWSQQQWTITGSMNSNRTAHTMTLLANGKVLAAGGFWSAYMQPTIYFASCELYDSASGRWTLSGNMNCGRSWHTATLLPNGTVVVAGGRGGTNGAILSTTEIYDPPTGQWKIGAAMSVPRVGHTATLLPDRRILVAGGTTNGALLGFGSLGGASSSAELYDLATGCWRATSPMNNARESHTATLLPNGAVLVAGGYAGVFLYGSNYLRSAELYNPITETWTLVGSLVTARANHSATLLGTGRILIAGGYNPDSNPGSSNHDLSSAEVFDPITRAWSRTYGFQIARAWHSAVLLASGEVLAVGGSPTAELYAFGDHFIYYYQRPQITTITSPLAIGTPLSLTGSGFRGYAEGSSGNTQDSAADYPVLQLRSIESGQTAFVPTTNWSANSFTSLPVTGIPPGYALATVFVNGAPGTSAVVNISIPVATPSTLTGPAVASNGVFGFFFTNSPGALFGALVSTSLALPLSNWTALGRVTETSPGRFQFTDPQVADGRARFYRLRSL